MMVEGIEYWAKWWEEGFTSWHKTYVHECLEQHYQKLIPSSEQPTKTRIFVPLCGKSLDMIWLEEKGFQVVGVEGVESVVAAFFQENNISFEVKPSPENPEIKCYHGIDKDITIYSVYLFKVATDTLGGSFDAVWDRGSLAAIGLYTENRGKRYADLLASLLRPNGRILVENHVYIDDPGPRSGPSHVPPEVLHDLFGDKFDIATLDVEDSPTKGPYNHSYNLMTLK